MIFVYVIGLPIMYYTADLSTINISLLEAAVVDGAGPWPMFRLILFPLTVGARRTIILSILLGSVPRLRGRLPLHGRWSFGADRDRRHLPLQLRHLGRERRLRLGGVGRRAALRALDLDRQPGPPEARPRGAQAMKILIARRRDCGHPRRPPAGHGRRLAGAHLSAR